MLDALQALYGQWCGAAPDRCETLPLSGSDRRYVRLGGPGGTVMGTWHRHDAENRAFVSFARHFRAQGLPVPEILADNLDQGVYLQEDLGDDSLLDRLLEERRGLPSGAEPERALDLYRQALRELARLQVTGGDGLDWSLCQHGDLFDRQAVLSDLNYFKYYFLKPHKVEFDERALENDFEALSAFLLQGPGEFFLYRDFQARNILVKDERVRFIDFQGGKKGPLGYDVASLLYQAKADLPETVREKLLDGYLVALRELVAVDEADFRERFRGFVLLRGLQVLGSYGFRGLFEKRRHFLDSIPYGLENIRRWLSGPALPIPMPELLRSLSGLCSPEIAGRYAPPLRKEEASVVHVEVMSFSYKKGLPDGHPEHGGGFVFDCRGIDNPGRSPEFRPLTGLDAPVADFLRARTEMPAFLEAVFALVDRHFENFRTRGHDRFSVWFGCTGGRHRSVFAANALSEHFRKKYGVEVALRHREPF